MRKMEGIRRWAELGLGWSCSVCLLLHLAGGEANVVTVKLTFICIAKLLFTFALPTLRRGNKYICINYAINLRSWLQISRKKRFKNAKIYINKFNNFKCSFHLKTTTISGWMLQFWHTQLAPDTELGFWLPAGESGEGERSAENKIKSTSKANRKQSANKVIARIWLAGNGICMCVCEWGSMCVCVCVRLCLPKCHAHSHMVNI